MTGDDELAIVELEEAHRLLGGFIEEKTWNSKFRKKKLAYVILKLENVKNNLF